MSEYNIKTEVSMIEFETTRLKFEGRTLKVFEKGFEPTCNKGDFIAINHSEYEVKKVVYDFETIEMVVHLV